jgi:hypothetical protein
LHGETLERGDQVVLGSICEPRIESGGFVWQEDSARG